MKQKHGKKGDLIPLFNNSYGWVQKESAFFEFESSLGGPTPKKKTSPLIYIL